MKNTAYLVGTGRLLALLALLPAAPVSAINWTNYPVGVPANSDTFLFGTSTTNKQISAASLAAWTWTYNLPSLVGMSGLNNTTQTNGTYVNGYFQGNGAGLTNVPASSLTGTSNNMALATNTPAAGYVLSATDTTGLDRAWVPQTSGGTVTNTTQSAFYSPYQVSPNTNMIIDPANGNYQAVILTNNTTLTWTNVGGAGWNGNGAFVRLEIWPGSYTLTWNTANLNTNLFSVAAFSYTSTNWSVFVFDKVAYLTTAAKVYQLQ